MEVASVLCVRNGARTSWIPVPTKRRGTFHCVALTSSKSPWAIRVLAGTKKDRDSGGAALVLKAFESNVRAQVSRLDVLGASPPSPKKQRLLDSDSESDRPESPEGDSHPSSFPSPPNQGSKAPTRRVDKVGFTKIELNGLEVDVGFHKGPGLLFPANAETVASVLKFLDQEYDVLLAAGRDINGQRLAARKDGPQELLAKLPPSECRKGAIASDTTAEVDTNKIRYDFGRSAFKLLYLEGGSLKRLSKGFEVPRTDAMGTVLSCGDYAKMKAGILRKARMAWNKLDQSDAPRFQDQMAACSHDP